GVVSSASPRFLRCALSAVRRNVMVATPGISIGYWNARNTPFAARSSGCISSTFSPSSRTSPSVTSYSALPASTCASVDLPDPFGPMIACTSPLFTTRSRPLRIFLPSISTCRFLISSRGIRPSFKTFNCHPGRAKRKLPHAPLKAHRNELLRLNGEFHRQLLQHVLDEAVHHERGRFLGRQSALAAVEQHV